MWFVVVKIWRPTTQSLKNISGDIWSFQLEYPGSCYPNCVSLHLYVTSFLHSIWRRTFCGTPCRRNGQPLCSRLHCSSLRHFIGPIRSASQQLSAFVFGLLLFPPALTLPTEKSWVSHCFIQGTDMLHAVDCFTLIIIIIIKDLYSAFRSEDTEAAI